MRWTYLCDMQEYIRKQYQEDFHFKNKLSLNEWSARPQLGIVQIRMTTIVTVKTTPLVKATKIISTFQNQHFLNSFVNVEMFFNESFLNEELQQT